MSGFVKAGFSFLKNLGKGSKVSPTITAIKPGTNLTKKKSYQDELIKNRGKIIESLSDQGKINVKTKNPLYKFKQKISKLVDEKAKGGRVGLKRGTGLMSRKSNIQKIKETFGPKNNNPKMSKAKKKFPDLTGDGKVTFADVLKGRGVINGKKKNKRFV